ncbi:putative outer membrane usher protein LpfC' [Pseudomonas fluorescens]|uniref:Putative outer membrane usher protein LpfC n=1 Tax=Pseudomonas fluorescens TaxID=294 RepID=A0A5E6TTQ9_PSEFL|nr:putative outer membrane usher protein LpfC' [Pseudomonas fluorescens]
MASHFYQAGTVGVSRDLGLLGALAVDVTHSGADINTQNSQHVQGVSYALKYGKTFASSTNLRFAGYRYSTEGYRDFDEAVRQRSHSTTWYGSRRSRLEASISQKLSTRSSLSLSLAQQDYWQHDNKERQFQLNFNTYHQGVNYSLFATQSLSDTRDPGRQIGLSISLPLEFGHSTNVTFDLQKVGEGYSQRASLGGSADASRISYRASLSNDDGRQQSAALSVGYQAAFGSLGGGLTQGNDYRTLSVNASGAMLMHADGIELGPYLGETAALVEVPGIAGVGVLNATGVRTNSQGYALVPYLRPYRLNHMVLQTDELGPEVEIDNGTAQLVPRRGAVVKATFPARIVTRMLLTTRSASGLPLPFGAQVSDSEGAVIGVVGQAGQVLLSTSAEPKTLDVRWGDQVEPQCQLHIDPLAMEQPQGYRLQTLTCG